MYLTVLRGIYKKQLLVTSRVSAFSGVSHSFTQFDRAGRRGYRHCPGVDSPREGVSRTVDTLYLERDTR